MAPVSRRYSLGSSHVLPPIREKTALKGTESVPQPASSLASKLASTYKPFNVFKKEPVNAWLYARV
ncbi:MAG: hypothetical protein COB84_07575 [Rhodobacteraceae bacterium]|nr:MAG: hypothetical protein COB84_07575 [Paracoccaceae bacterium]